MILTTFTVIISSTICFKSFKRISKQIEQSTKKDMQYNIINFGPSIPTKLC